MTIPSLPEEEPRPSRVDESEEIPSAIPQGLMNAVSIVMVFALILGSVSTVIYLTDMGLDFAIMIGLIVAACLVAAWFLMRRKSMNG
jgi:hypothetical protein